jgi:hypothetical protein
MLLFTKSGQVCQVLLRAAKKIYALIRAGSSLDNGQRRQLHLAKG